MELEANLRKYYSVVEVRRNSGATNTRNLRKMNIQCLE